MQLRRKLKAPLIQFPAVRRYLVEKPALSDAWIEAMAQRDCLVAERWQHSAPHRKRLFLNAMLH
jgi:hypothetical protein